MSLSIGSLERAIHAGSFSNVLDLDRARARLGYDQMQEIEHQFQIAIEGFATANLTWSVFDLPFDVEFFFAPQQRDSPLTVPHFTYGASVQGEVQDVNGNPITDPNNPNGQVGVFANVVGWASDVAREAITGARVGVGVICGGPDVSTQVDFHGYLHLTFQGYGQVGGADQGDNNAQLNVGT